MDLVQYAYSVAALLFVLSLIVLAGWVMRRIGFVGALPSSSRNRQRRLGVVEVLPLDAKRRLVLVRRDDREHLLLLSAFGDVVVDGGAPTGLAADFRGALADAAPPERAR